MAFGRFGNQGRGHQPLHAINVTPLVDVMLVLVVIFILAAPMLAASLRLQLPRAEGAKAQSQAGGAHALLVEIDAGGEIRLQGQVVDEQGLKHRFEQLSRSDADAEIQLRADTRLAYGRVVELMGWAHAAGLTRIAFVTEPEKP
ncbi:ExbD/TolR family protein [Comamonas composti]|uniref:ExbD/TolR family protein n=1 Tax=Comamonas composti TaxID=408558 RepID=UPI000408D125|nr:biopolymer transporter ExbD [Comamonas composti]